MKKGIDRDGDGVIKVVLVERVEQASTDSGGSVAGTHPVSAAAGGSDRMADAAGTLGNSSHRTSSGSGSPDRNSQSSKLSVEDTEVVDHLNWFESSKSKCDIKISNSVQLLSTRNE